MRKVALIALTALTVGMGFSSCKKDKNEAATSFTGTWNVNSLKAKVTFSGVPFIDTTINYAPGDYTITFNDNKSFVAVSKKNADDNATGTYALDGNKINMMTIDSDGDTSSSSGTYSISGKNMTISSSETDPDLGATSESQINLTKQ